MVADQRGEWTEQADEQLDQQYAELQPEGTPAVAPGVAEALDPTFGAELTQVVAELAKPIGVAVSE